jgi:PIN domain nuclease of toxin-antitoxin system
VTDARTNESIVLDTNVFLFFINNDPVLSDTARERLESNVDLLISVASLWEIAIKISIGRLELPSSFKEFIPAQLAHNEIEIIPIALSHLAAVEQLPLNHKDPFDRLIIAQALVLNLPVASSDKAFDSYGIERIW